MAIEIRNISGVIVEDDFNDEWETIWEHPEHVSQKTQDYVSFMNNPANSGNCSECPANEDFSEWPGYRLPCGQFNCWVDCHCQDN